MNISPLLSILSSYDKHHEICYQLVPFYPNENFYEACSKYNCQEPAVVTERNKCFLLNIMRENCVDYAGIAHNKVLCANGDIYRYQPNNPCCPQPNYVLCQKLKRPEPCDSSSSICDNLPLLLLLYCLCNKHHEHPPCNNSK